MMKNRFLLYAICAIALILSACSAEDRSGEQPFAPTVALRSATANGNVLSFEGIVTASPNSELTACGFHYGNDSIQETFVCAEPCMTFSGEVDSMTVGQYYVVAYATNKMGTTTSDTLWCTIIE